MTAHTCTTLTPGCYRCELSQDEAMAAIFEIERDAEAEWIAHRDRELSRGRNRRQLRKADFMAGFCLASGYDRDL